MTGVPSAPVGGDGTGATRRNGSNGSTASRVRETEVAEWG